ncbi:MAG: hypothetical protein IH936_13680 [Acidobacteria bacterium]|nr:hypothetical protein [Acidobacteriota bacterium]
MNEPQPQLDTAASKVLIVDDDDFLASISDLLETEGGFSVDTAGDSESAIRSARELPPDIALSHELRTPLTTIIGWGELLKVKADKSESTEVSAGADRILTAAVHLLDLINEILDLATIEAGRIQLEMEPIELRGPVKDSLFLISPLAEKRNLEIEDRLSTCATCLVVGDRRRLKQIFINLLSNAVKYNEEGGKILLSYEELEANRIRIMELDCEQVSDTSAKNGEGGQPHIREHTLLYVEDDPSTLELMVSIVSQIPGWRIVTMETGRDGLEYARKNPPDFVLLDIKPA